MDTKARAGLLTGHAGGAPWPARVSGVREFPLERRSRGQGRGKEGDGRLPDVRGVEKEQGRDWEEATASARSRLATELPALASAGKTTREASGFGRLGPSLGRKVSFPLFC